MISKIPIQILNVKTSRKNRKKQNYWNYRGIGSGKSTVSKFIEELGFPVYDSDFWAKNW